MNWSLGQPTSDEYYPPLRRPEFRGHSDFTGGDEFDFTKEDRGLSSPFIRPGPHFQDLDTSRDQVREAIDLGDKDRFERAMHRLQDFYTHYDKGFRWDPWHGYFGHLFYGTAPDHDEDAWEEAERESRVWVDLWHDQNGTTTPSGPCH